MRRHLHPAVPASVLLLVGLAACGGHREQEPSPEPPDPSQPIKCEGHEDVVGSVAVAPDGKVVVSGSDDQTLRFWGARDGRLIRTVKPFDPPVRGAWVGGLAFAPDGKTLVACPCGPSGQGLQFYDAETGMAASARSRLTKGGYYTAFSPDGKALAVACDDGIRVWGVASGEKLHEFTFDRGIRRTIGQAWRVTYSPDGKHLAAALHAFGADREEGPLVRVWDLGTSREVFTAWYGGHANAVAFSPDGKLLAAGGEIKGTVQVYEWASKKVVADFQADAGVVFCLAFSADGKALYTGGNDAVVKRWLATSGKPAGTLKGHTSQVKDLCLSKDGKVLASVSRDKRVLIWHLGVR